MSKLSRYERETIILFNKAENVAEVFTYEKSWQRIIENKLGIQPFEDNGFGGRFYKVPKTMIRPPIAPFGRRVRFTVVISPLLTETFVVLY